jgi:hypothetical protein
MQTGVKRSKNHGQKGAQTERKIQAQFWNRDDGYRTLILFLRSLCLLEGVCWILVRAARKFADAEGCRIGVESWEGAE